MAALLALVPGPERYPARRRAASVFHHALQMQQERGFKTEVFHPVVGDRVLFPVGDKDPRRIFLHDGLHFSV